MASEKRISSATEKKQLIAVLQSVDQSVKRIERAILSQARPGVPVNTETGAQSRTNPPRYEDSNWRSLQRQSIPSRSRQPLQELQQQVGRVAAEPQIGRPTPVNTTEVLGRTGTFNTENQLPRQDNQAEGRQGNQADNINQWFTTPVMDPYEDQQENMFF